MLSAKIGYFRAKFDPRSISGLVGWFEADDASTFTLSGNVVSEWRDKGGNGYAVSQGTAGSRPSRVGTVGGRATIDFDGTDDCLFSDNTGLSTFFTGDKPVTVFCVGQMHNSAEISVNQLGTWFSFGSSASGTPFLYARSNGASGVAQLQLRNDASSGGGSAVGTGPAGDGTEPTVNISDAFIASIISPSQSYGVMRTHTVMAATGSGISGRPQNGAVVVGGLRPAGSLTSNRFTIGALGRNAFSDFFPARISEILVYNRVLSDTERVVLAQYLGAKYSLAVFDPTFPTVSNADAQDWIYRVYGNGGTVSTSTAAAVNTFCNSIDAAGIRDRFYRLNLFAGTGLAAALVPLYRGQSLGGTQFGGTTDTNINFVSGDYTETGSNGGLRGDGGVKRLTIDTLSSTAITAGNAHLSVYGADLTSGGGDRAVIGTRPATANNQTMQIWTSETNTQLNRGLFGNSSSPVNGSPVSSQGHLVCSATSSTDLRFYVSGSQTGITTADRGNNVLANATPMYVFSAWSNGLVYPNGPNPGRIAAYSYGLGLSASQVASYNTALQAFQTALSRNV